MEHIIRQSYFGPQAFRASELQALRPSLCHTKTNSLHERCHRMCIAHEDTSASHATWHASTAQPSSALSRPRRQRTLPRDINVLDLTFFLVIPSVVCLFFECCPPAVFRCVVPKSVYSIDGLAFWSFAHVF